MIKFTQLYKQLNPDQRRAVDTIEGPVLVIAGPGTGKTQVLTLRIANILRLTDTPPEAILCLTFTRSGVYSMRQRLVEIVGPAGYRVNIHTFHGFCQQVIKDWPDDFPGIIGSSPATILDQLQIFRATLASGTFPILRPYGNPDYYLLALLSELERLKRENVSPESLQKILEAEEINFSALPDRYHIKGRFAGRLKGKYQNEQKRLMKNLELAQVYREYEAALRTRRLYDFGDMIMEVLKGLRENQDLALRLQEEYQYLLADEHQDANQSQNELLELLSAFHPSPNLFIVGDEKQAIYQFQGASLDNFNYFKRRFPEAALIALRYNYRSPQGLLDAAWSLLAKSESLGPDSHPKLLAARSLKKVLVNLAAFSEANFEINFLVEAVQDLLRAKVPAVEIAIIYRHNRDSEVIVEAFDRAKIEYQLTAPENILADQTVRKLLLLARAVADFNSTETLAEALFLDFLRLPVIAVHQALREAKVKECSLIEALTRSSEEKLKHFANLFLAWQTAAKNETPEVFFDNLVRQSGLLEQLLEQPDAQLKLEKLRALFDQARNLNSRRAVGGLSEFLSYLDLLTTHGLKINASLRAVKKGVVLLTAHKAKGLEFDYVFLVNAYDGHWGGRRARRLFVLPLRGVNEEGDQLADERRLFYVALTRAKKALTITYAKLSHAGESRLPSRFLEEIDAKSVKLLPVEKEERRYQQSKVHYPAMRRAPGPALDNRSYLRQLFLDQGFSVTALNNYLECPWKYFFQNLLRLPAAKTKPLIFGTAVHGALARFFGRVSRDERPRESYLLKTFSQLISGAPLNPADQKACLEKGHQALTGYYHTYRRQWPKPLHNEFAVRGVKLSPELKLTGIIDKLEIGPSADTVRVVDYKTGLPKSRAALLGKTKGSSRNYFRQLLFYKLLLKHYSGPRYQVIEGTIDFIEPTKSGRYQQETFALEDEAVIDLEILVREKAKEILSFKFWRVRCGQPDCSFCRLRDLMKK